MGESEDIPQDNDMYSKFPLPILVNNPTPSKTPQFSSTSTQQLLDPYLNDLLS